MKGNRVEREYITESRERLLTLATKTLCCCWLRITLPVDMAKMKEVGKNRNEHRSINDGIPIDIDHHSKVVAKTKEKRAKEKERGMKCKMNSIG